MHDATAITITNTAKAFFQSLFALGLCVLIATKANAEIYQWTDDQGKKHFSDTRPGQSATAIKSTTAEIPKLAKLDVPMVRQGKMLCGPTAIEMLFRYWRVDEYSQYDIAYNLLHQFDYIAYVKRSGILNKHPIDWMEYPGTSIANMRNFLELFSSTQTLFIPTSASPSQSIIHDQFQKLQELKRYVASGVPVVVSQYSNSISRKGHYRVMVGYDDNKKEVYLNDPNRGRAVTQSYNDFFQLLKVGKAGSQYNALVFNPSKKMLNIRLKKYDKKDR